MTKERKPTKHLIGRRVRLTKIADASKGLSPGMRGTVVSFDDSNVVYVEWDRGDTVGVDWFAGDRWLIDNDTTE